MRHFNLTFISVDAAIHVLEAGPAHPCYHDAERFLAQRLGPDFGCEAAIEVGEQELLDQLEAEAQLAATLVGRIAEENFKGIRLFSKISPPSLGDDAGDDAFSPPPLIQRNLSGHK